MSLRFALIGNQNSGKTTLFNQLTGSNQHVGNFPGVTVQMKEGTILKHPEISMIDLPGIYSLSPYSSEEIVTRDQLLYQKPDLIINVVDVTSIERSLYLSMQCIELDIPMVIALNMMDELRSSHGNVDILAMEKELSLPVVPISAQNGDGVQELLTRAIQTAKNRQLPGRHDFCPNTSPVHVAIHAVAHLIEEKVRSKNLPLRFFATKLIEGDDIGQDELNLNENERDIIGHFVQEMETSLKTDKQAAMADMRYNYIDYLCQKTVTKPTHTQAQIRSWKIDEILTHKYLGLPIFMGIMATIFYLTFDLIGGTLSDYFEEFLEYLTESFSAFLTSLQVSEGLHSLLIDGACAGVSSVLSFLPTILVLFFFLSLLQDSGYMARVAFVMDKLLRKIGLSGASFVPMLIGFGCSVPAIMATRTLPSERDRKMTILITPFMSCSAKLPVYAVFIAALFPDKGSLVMFSLYMTGIIVAVLSAILMRHTTFQGKPVPFVMELPPYRIPGVRSVWMQIRSKAKDFLRRAFTIIFLASMIIWFLQNFNSHFYMVSDPTTSIIADLGKLLAPFFAPLGFDSWQASAALVTGWTAKEVVISTLSVLTNAGEGDPNLQAIFPDWRSAYAYLTFCLLYPPCAAAMATIRRELNSFWQMIAVSIYQIGVAWLMAFLVYRALAIL